MSTSFPNEEVAVPDTGTGDVDKPGEGTEGEENAIVKALGDIAGKYGYDNISDANAGKCEDAAKEMKAYLKSKKEKGAIVTLKWTPGKYFFIWSDIANKIMVTTLNINGGFEMSEDLKILCNFINKVRRWLANK